MLRKVRDREEASRYLESAEASGLPRADWARRHGIDARSLNAWRMNLERGRPTPRLVELIPREAPSSRYAVRFGDFVVEVDEHFDEGTLRRLLCVVTEC